MNKTKPAKNIYFKSKVSRADSTGRDLGQGKLEIIISMLCIWFSDGLNIDTACISTVRKTPKGFTLSWSDKSGHHEDFFCVKSLFGYNLKERDKIVRYIDFAAEEIKDY